MRADFGEGPDATRGSFGVDARTPPTVDAADEDAARFNGGAPFACLGCTCDGTLYGCLQNAMPDGGCPNGGPPHTHAPLDDGGALDEAGTGLGCAVDPSGNGFVLTCPPPDP